MNTISSTSMPMQTRRRKKRGDKEHERRMEDAVKAILPLGFTRELILSTMDHLLQVYGGEKSWVFLEEDNYKLLVDTILQGVESCSSKTGVLHQETNTKQIDIHVLDVNFNENKLKAKLNKELEGCKSNVDENCTDQACGQSEEVALTENQLSNSSISNENLPRKDETKFGSQNDCTDGDVTLIHERDIGVSSASMTDAVPCSSNKDGTIDGDVDLSHNVEDVLASIRARIACWRALNAEKKAEKSLEPFIGCKMDHSNSWKREEKEVSKKEKDEEYKKGSKEHRDVIERALQENSLTENTSMTFKPEYDLPSTHVQTVLSCSQITAVNSCLVKNFVQEPSQLLSKSGIDPILKSWDCAISSQTVSLPVRHQLQDENSTRPLKRKPCFGWLSDDESSPERSDIPNIHDDVFCNDNMTADTRSCLERYGSGRNNENRKATMLSNAKQLPDINSSDYDYRQCETDILRSVNWQSQTCRNHSKEIGEKYIGYNKYEHTKSGMVKQDLHIKVPHENETHDKSSHMFRELGMDKCLGGSILTKASFKMQSSHEEHVTYGSANLNCRKGGKPLLQTNSKYSSYHRKTSLQPLGNYQRSESRRMDLNYSRTQHVEWGSCDNLEKKVHVWHQRDEDERNSQKLKNIFSDNRYSADQRYSKGRNPEKEHKLSLRHERKDFGDVKNAHNSDHEIREVGDKVHFSNNSYASSHFPFSSGHDGLKPYSKRNEGHPQPSKRLKMRRWDVKPDLSK